MADLFYCPICGEELTGEEQQYCSKCYNDIPTKWADPFCGDCGDRLIWNGGGWYCNKCGRHPIDVEFRQGE